MPIERPKTPLYLGPRDGRVFAVLEASITSRCGRFIKIVSAPDEANIIVTDKIEEVEEYQLMGRGVILFIWSGSFVTSNGLLVATFSEDRDSIAEFCTDVLAGMARSMTPGGDPDATSL